MYGEYISVGSMFPAFTLNGVNGDNELKSFSSEDIEGWWVFYFYPKDFTFICPTEISAMDRLVDEGVNVFGFSGDNEFCKLNWKIFNSEIEISDIWIIFSKFNSCSCYKLLTSRN